MRPCPVCLVSNRTEAFRMGYRVPDGWPLPAEIVWYTCDACGMIYGDGDFDQAMLNEYYAKYYGYDLNHPDNVARLRMDALSLVTATHFKRASLIVDFGGAGDDGKSVLVDALREREYLNAHVIGPGDDIPAGCAVVYASHVLEHIYNLHEAMLGITTALAPDGLLIVDVPDSIGLLQRWKMPILDFNTKHLNHFTLRNLLDLGFRYGLEASAVRQYELESAPCIQVKFRRQSIAANSAEHVKANMTQRAEKLRGLTGPVNVWGLSDIAWHLMSQVDLRVEDYIDNDPAYRGQTYRGKPIHERPTNGAPIVIMAQRQRGRLIANIRKAGFQNRIIEI